MKAPEINKELMKSDSPICLKAGIISKLNLDVFFLFNED